LFFREIAGYESAYPISEQNPQSSQGGNDRVTSVTRTRRCLGCGSTAESCKRWTSDPWEAGSQRIRQVLEVIGGASDQIRRALYEANAIPDPEDAEGDPEGGHPGYRG